MKIVIKELEEKVAEMKKDIANYYKWIAECRKSGNGYGVTSYTESRNELKKLLPKYSEAIKIIKKYSRL